MVAPPGEAPASPTAPQPGATPETLALMPAPGLQGPLLVLPVPPPVLPGPPVPPPVLLVPLPVLLGPPVPPLVLPGPPPVLPGPPLVPPLVLPVLLGPSLVLPVLLLVLPEPSPLLVLPVTVPGWGCRSVAPGSCSHDPAQAAPLPGWGVADPPRMDVGVPGSTRGAPGVTRGILVCVGVSHSPCRCPRWCRCCHWRWGWCKLPGTHLRVQRGVRVTPKPRGHPGMLHAPQKRWGSAGGGEGCWGPPRGQGYSRRVQQGGQQRRGGRQAAAGGQRRVQGAQRGTQRGPRPGGRQRKRVPKRRPPPVPPRQGPPGERCCRATARPKSRPWGPGAPVSTHRPPGHPQSPPDPHPLPF